MIAVERRLEGISSGYCVFEKDQVLTHDQLNSIAEYADDQIRLTRVGLLGVGIACGLRPSLSGSTVRVSRGIGITTDGDLAYFAQDLVFDRFKPYDQSFPAYAPLYVAGNVNGTMIPAYELVAQGVADPRASALSGFAAAAGRALNSMTALLLVESYDKDDDLCSGTDCDNLGAEAVNTPKVLLVETPPATLLQGSIVTPSQWYSALADIVVPRPTFASTIPDAAQLAAVYRGVCNTLHTRITGALPTVSVSAATFIAETVGAGTAATWNAKLADYRTTFAATGVGIQYYYDFLKDVAETFNEFRDCLFGDFTTCAPVAETFPKHLLLGATLPGANPDANRTGFYPSPLTGKSAGELDRARFLLRRLDALIMRFQVNTSTTSEIRITPSAFEDRPLEERAIPFYYTSGGTTDPINRKWSYSLVRRGMEAFTHSYHATGWGTQSGTATPLANQLGRYSFFRVEGHVGKAIGTALTTLEGAIRANNLPFTVRAVHLGTQTANVVQKPGPRITDLHHIHQIVRRDLARRIEEAKEFNDAFTKMLKKAIQDEIVDDHAADYDTTSINTTATQSEGIINGHLNSAGSSIAGSYVTYQGQSSTWQQAYGSAISAAGQYKYQVSAVTKTEFSTPFDTLISHAMADWVPWLDQIISWKEERAEQKLLFSRFAEEHPQIEHFGGVPRGGTLVLVHDATTVIADFMLPYAWLEQPFETQEPTLTDPPEPARPKYVREEGAKIIPSRVTVMEREWKKKFKPEIERELDWKPQLEEMFELQNKFFEDKFNFQKEVFDDRLELQTKHIDEFQTFYLESFKDSMEVVTKLPSYSYSNVQMPGQDLGVTEQQFDDKLLGLFVQEANIRKGIVDTLREEMAKPGINEETAKQYEQMVNVAEEALAATIEQTTTYVAETGVSVTPGTEGFTALVEMSTNQLAITSEATNVALKENLAVTVDKMDAQRAGVVAGVMNVQIRGL